MRQRGFSLIELLVVLVIGVIALGAIVGTLMSSSRTLSTIESLSRINDDARTTIAYLKQDLHQVGSKPCFSSEGPVYRISTAGLLSGGRFEPSMHLFNANENLPRGLGASAYPAIVALSVYGKTFQAVSRQGDNTLVLTEAHHYPAGAWVLICDGRSARIVEVESGSGTSSITFKQDVRDFSPTAASSALLSGYREASWYVATDEDSQRHSLLYLREDGSSNLGGSPQVLAEGITDFRLGYLIDGDNRYRPTLDDTDWANIRAMEVIFSLEQPTSSGEMLQRQFATTIMFRNQGEE